MSEPRRLIQADCDQLCSLYHLSLLELAVWFHGYRSSVVTSMQMLSATPLQTMGHDRNVFTFSHMQEALDILMGSTSACNMGLLPRCSREVRLFIEEFSHCDRRGDWLEQHKLDVTDNACLLMQQVWRVATDYYNLLTYRESLVFCLHGGGLDIKQALHALATYSWTHEQLITQLYRSQSQLNHLGDLSRVSQLYHELHTMQESIHKALYDWWDEKRTSQWEDFTRICLENRFITKVADVNSTEKHSVMYRIEQNKQRNFCLLLLQYRDNLKYSLKSEGLSSPSTTKKEIDDNQLLELIACTIVPAISSSVFSKAKAGFRQNSERARLTPSTSGLEASSADIESVAGVYPLSIHLHTIMVPLCGTSLPALHLAA